MNKANKTHSIKWNFIFSLGNNLINILAPFIITPYVARVLGAENMGIYSYSTSVANFFMIFALLGVANYGNRSIAKVRDDKKERSKVFWEIYYLQLFLSLLISAAYLFYVFVFSENTIVSLTLILLVLSAGLDITWFYSGMENFKFILLRNLIIKAIDLVFVFLLVRNSGDVVIYTLIMSAGFLISNAFMWTSVSKSISFNKPSVRRSLRHLKPNLVLFIPVIAIYIYNFMDKIMLGGLSNMAQVGFYDNSEKIMGIPQAIVTALGYVMLPRVTNMIANGKTKETESYLKKSLLFVAFISSACTFGIVTISREFVLLYLGEEFEPCVTLLYYLMPCLIFKAYGNVLRMQYIIPNGKDNIYVVSVCLGAVINLVLNWIFIPHLQAIGACIGTIAAEIIVCVYQIIMVGRSQKIIKPLILGMGFQAIGMVMFVFVSNLPLEGSLFGLMVIKILIGGITYLLLASVYYYLIDKENVKALVKKYTKRN